LTPQTILAGVLVLLASWTVLRMARTLAFAIKFARRGSTDFPCDACGGPVGTGRLNIAIVASAAGRFGPFYFEKDAFSLCAYCADAETPVAVVRRVGRAFYGPAAARQRTPIPQGDEPCAPSE
jgi:hypothetical protein